MCEVLLGGGGGGHLPSGLVPPLQGRGGNGVRVVSRDQRMRTRCSLTSLAHVSSPCNPVQLVQHNIKFNYSTINKEKKAYVGNDCGQNFHLVVVTYQMDIFPKIPLVLSLHHLFQ